MSYTYKITKIKYTDEKEEAVNKSYLPRTLIARAENLAELNKKLGLLNVKLCSVEPISEKEIPCHII